VNDINTNRFLNIVAALFVVGFSFYVLKELQSIFLPFFIAAIIAILFEPFYEWLKSKKIPGPISLIIVVIVIILLSNITSLFVLTSITSFQGKIPEYVEKGSIMISKFTGYFSQYEFLRGIDLSGIVTTEKLTQYASGVISSIVNLFANFILILIYIIFLISEIGSIKKRILSAFSSSRARQIADTLSDIFQDVRKYILGKTLINLSHGLFVTAILWIFGVDFFLVWGFLAFLMAFIPNIGSLISTILPFTISLIQFEGEYTKPIIILVLMIVSANIVGNIIEPKVLGDKLNLSPILLLFSLIFWGYLWGIVGMILSVPIMSMIKIVLSKFEQTKPLSILMSYNISKTKK
jgi:AI-2 transport protein TqsA